MKACEEQKVPHVVFEDEGDFVSLQQRPPNLHKSSIRNKEINIWSQLFGGRAQLRGPGEVQVNTGLTHQEEGTHATCLASFQ